MTCDIFEFFALRWISARVSLISVRLLSCILCRLTVIISPESRSMGIEIFISPNSVTHPRTRRGLKSICAFIAGHFLSASVITFNITALSVILSSFARPSLISLKTFRNSDASGSFVTTTWGMSCQLCAVMFAIIFLFMPKCSAFLTVSDCFILRTPFILAVMPH